MPRTGPERGEVVLLAATARDRLLSSSVSHARILSQRQTHGAQLNVDPCARKGNERANQPQDERGAHAARIPQDQCRSREYPAESTLVDNDKQRRRRDGPAADDAVAYQEHDAHESLAAV